LKRGTVGYRPTWTEPYRFVAAFDAHWGYEIAGGKKQPMHNRPAIDAMLQFTQDYKPHAFVLGGDQLDLGAISHHNERKKVSVEGLRIQQDIDEMSANLMAPVEDMGVVDTFWMLGNHEEWLNQLTDQNPGLADTLTFEKLLNLSDRGWKEVPQGGHVDLGKLRFVHGDVLGGGDAVAKAAIIEHGKSIAFGHFHTHQEYTKHSPVDSKDVHIGIACPALANRGPAYGKRRANKWVNGFLYGAIFPDGTFNHQVIHITDGRFFCNGKVYKG
jgi:hypothetical protein